MPSLDDSTRDVLKRYGQVVEVAATCKTCGWLGFVEVAGAGDELLIVPNPAVRDLGDQGLGVVHLGCGGEIELARP